MTDFNLSDKINPVLRNSYSKEEFEALYVKDVRKFIWLLKDETFWDNEISPRAYKKIKNKIDKLAGEKLI